MSSALLDISAYSTMRDAMHAAGLRRSFEIYSGGQTFTFYFTGKGELFACDPSGFWSKPAAKAADSFVTICDRARAIKAAARAR
jgi:hypothetical protein